MGRLGVVVMLVLLGAAPAAAAKSLMFSDGICEYRVAFDPAKVDRKRLKATFDYLVSGRSTIEIGPALSSQDAVDSIDIPAYRGVCAAHRKSLEAPRFVDLAGVEALRRQEIAELDDACAMTEAKLRAAKGDADALNAYTPAAACAPFVDTLKLPKEKLVAGWPAIVEDLCRTSTEPRVCVANLVKEKDQPNAAARLRLMVLTDGWADCAQGKLLAFKGGSPTAAETPSDRERARLKDALLKQYKAKALSCAQ